MGSIGEWVLNKILYIGNAGGNNAKLKALAGVDLEDATLAHVFANFIRYVLDPGFNYYMTKAGIPDPYAYVGVQAFTSDVNGLMQLLQSMSERTVSGKKLEQMVATWLHYTDATHRWLFEIAISRQLPGNVGKTMVNKVWPGHIYQQPYPKCSSWDVNKAADLFGNPVVWERKEDGMCLMLDFRSKTVRTRQGQNVTAQMMPHLKSIFDTWDGEHVAQCEGMIWNEEGTALMDRPAANGIFNAIFKTGREISSDRVQLVLLDMIPCDEFYGLTAPSQMQGTRRENVEALAADYNNRIATITTYGGNLKGRPELRDVESVAVNDLNAARRLTQIEISRGGEGGIIKDTYADWKHGKIKMKNEFECTLVCRGFKPHTKNPAWVGSLLLESADGVLSTYAGSGLNEIDGDPLDRRKPDNFLNGTLWEVRAEKPSENNALQLPRLVEPRFDKDAADTFEEVMGAYRDSISLANNC